MNSRATYTAYTFDFWILQLTEVNHIVMCRIADYGVHIRSLNLTTYWGEIILSCAQITAYTFHFWILQLSVANHIVMCGFCFINGKCNIASQFSAIFQSISLDRVRSPYFEDTLIPIPCLLWHIMRRVKKKKTPFRVQ